MKIRAFVAACALGVAGCGDDPVSPGADSTLSFTYTGAGASTATTFSAAGQVPNLDITFGSSAWATGATDPNSNYTTVAGAIPHSSTTADLAVVSIARKTPGTSSIDLNCSDIESTDCTGMFLLMNFQPDGDNYSYSCFLTSGSVTLTAVTAEKITGSFSGNGTCFSPTGLESPLAITSGAFNVDVTSQLFGTAAARVARSSLLHRSRR